MEWEVIKLKNLKNNNYTLLYSFYQLLLYPLLYKNLKNKYLKFYIKKYEKYQNLFDFFDRFELKNNLITIEDYLNNFTL